MHYRCVMSIPAKLMSAYALVMDSNAQRYASSKLYQVKDWWWKGTVCKITSVKIWLRKIKKRITMLHKTCEVNIWHDSTGGKYNVVYYGIFKIISSLLVFSLFFTQELCTLIKWRLLTKTCLAVLNYPTEEACTSKQSLEVATPARSFRRILTTGTISLTLVHQTLARQDIKYVLFLSQYFY